MSSRESVWADSFSPLSVKLTITEPSGVSRTQEPVSTGIPLPIASNILDTNILRVVKADGITGVPAQFTVLARWDGLITDVTKPIKWVLVDFQADAAANGTSIYYLKDGGTGNAQTGISVTTDTNLITVVTGAGTFTINRTAFKLFSTVDLGSGLLVNNPSDGLVLTGTDGLNYSSANIAPSEVIVETAGTLHAVIRVRGKLSSGSATLKGGNGAKSGPGPMQGYYASASPENKELEYLLRLHFYKDKSFVRIEQTLINDGNGFDGANNSLYFNSMALDTSLTLGATRTAVVEGVTNSAASSDQYALLQTHAVVNTTDESVNFSYTRKKNGIPLDNGGTRATGYIDLSDTTQGLTVAMRHFWQNYPKGLRITNTKVSADLFPSVQSPYFNRGGQYKTYELLYFFHQGSFSASGSGNLVAAFQNPLGSQANPSWYAETWALGLIAPSGLTSTDPARQDAFNRFEQLQRIKYNGTEASNGKSLITYREHRELNGDWYGWNDFGDILYRSMTGMFSGIGYDFPYSMMLHYLRTGNRPFWDIGMEMVTHMSDFDLYHGSSLSRGAWEKGMAMWMDGGHYATPGVYAGLVEQNQGYCLAYALTGQPRYLESCKLAADSAWSLWVNYASTAPDTYKSELRIYGWAILRLLTYYKMSGDVTYLNQAMTIFTDGLLAFEQSGPPLGSNGQGYVYDVSGDCPTTEVRILMLGYITDPVVELHRLTGSTVVRDYLIRMLDFVRTKAFTGGTTDGSGKYKPYQTPYCYNPSTGARQFRDIQVIYNYFFAGGYSYLYAITQNTTYLNFSRNLFKDSIFYWDVTSDTYRDPLSKTPIYLSYEPQTAKQHGWIGRFHQGYLAMEYQLQKNGGTLPAWYPLGTPTMGTDPIPPIPPSNLKVQ